MQVSHTPAAVSVSFDEPNLIGAAGLVPVMELAAQAGLHQLAGGRLSVPTDKGANAGAKVAALVAGMCTGADSIDDMAVLRHGAMKRVFGGCYAPSTLGSFLRSFTFGHVRQLDAVASRFLVNLAGRAPLLGRTGAAGADPGFVYVDVDDTIIEVHGYQKQGSGYGYSGVRGLNALLATASTETAAPVILGQRLRRGAVGSPRGAGRMVGDVLATLKRLRPGSDTRVLVRADAAFYGHPTVAATLAAGADVSVTARMDKAVKAAIATIDVTAWTGIEYPEAIYDETTGTWTSKAEVAEVPFTAFTSKKKAERIPGRLMVRRIPELNPQDTNQPTLFNTHRFHAFFTTVDPEVLDTVTADRTHRGHALIEQVNADLKDSALAHLPSGHFGANSAWLVCAVMAYNLTRTAGTLAAGEFARARTGTIRARLVNLPARIASSARRIRIRLPETWPWQQGFERLFTAVHPPPQPPDHPPGIGTTERTSVEHHR